MTRPLNGKRVAILVTDGFEQVELTGPKSALERSGVKVHILSQHDGQVKGWHHDKPADDFKVDKTFEATNIDDYDAIVLPGGVQNSDTIRCIPAAQKLIKAHNSLGKPIAVICHGGWLLVSAGLVKGKTMTSYSSLKDDITNAGGRWVDEEVVTDGNLISSREPDDLPAFSKQLIEAMGS